MDSYYDFHDVRVIFYAYAAGGYLCDYAIRYDYFLYRFVVSWRDGSFLPETFAEISDQVFVWFRVCSGPIRVVFHVRYVCPLFHVFRQFYFKFRYGFFRPFRCVQRQCFVRVYFRVRVQRVGTITATQRDRTSNGYNYCMVGSFRGLVFLICFPCLRFRGRYVDRSMIRFLRGGGWSAR